MDSRLKIQFTVNCFCLFLALAGPLFSSEVYAANFLTGLFARQSDSSELEKLLARDSWNPRANSSTNYQVSWDALISEFRADLRRMGIDSSLGKEGKIEVVKSSFHRTLFLLPLNRSVLGKQLEEIKKNVGIDEVALELYENVKDMTHAKVLSVLKPDGTHSTILYLDIESLLSLKMSEEALNAVKTWRPSPNEIVELRRSVDAAKIGDKFIAPSPPPFISDFELENSEWLQQFLRFPQSLNAENTPRIRQMVENTLAGVSSSFDPWFRGQSQISFEDMLREQHRISTIGKEAGSSYLGYFKGAGGGSLTAVAPGQFVWEVIVDSRFPHLSYPPSITMDPREMHFQILEKPRSYATELDGIPPMVWPSQFRIHEASTGEYSHFYTSVAYRKEFYFPRMKVLMTKLRTEYTQLSDSEYLSTLADYYQIASNSHPFKRVNNTVFMAQVNYLLQIRGFKPISHKALDYHALSESSAEFRVRFLREVMKTYSGAVICQDLFSEAG